MTGWPVASALTIDVQSQLQSDTGDEIVALLRVIIHTIDNTTFSEYTPTIPQWTAIERSQNLQHKLFLDSQPTPSAKDEHRACAIGRSRRDRVVIVRQSASRLL